MNISQETRDKIESEFAISLIEDDYITVWDENMTSYTMKAPKKKEVTLSWIYSRINSRSKFKNIATMVEKNLNLAMYSVYPTSYGIGVDVILRKKESIESDIESVKTFLNSLGLEYRTESSAKGWVYRFIISKKESNLEKLN